VTFNFCPECGGTVFWEPEQRPELIAVAVGMFADPDFEKPRNSVWEKRQHPWTTAIAEQQIEHSDWGTESSPVLAVPGWCWKAGLGRTPTVCVVRWITRILAAKASDIAFVTIYTITRWTPWLSGSPIFAYMRLRVSASCDVGSSPISRRDPARESIGDASLDVKAGGGTQQPPAGKERCFTTYGASVNRYRAFLHPSNGGITQLTVLDGFVVLKLPLLGGHPPLGLRSNGARTTGKSRPQGDPADLSCDHVAEPARLSRHVFLIGAISTLFPGFGASFAAGAMPFGGRSKGHSLRHVVDLVPARRRCLMR
jgi:hypothetical protein